MIFKKLKPRHSKIYCDSEVYLNLLFLFFHRSGKWERTSQHCCSGGVKVQVPSFLDLAEWGVAPDCSWVELGWELRLSHVVRGPPVPVGHGESQTL